MRAPLKILLPWCSLRSGSIISGRLSPGGGWKKRDVFYKAIVFVHEIKVPNDMGFS